LGVIQQSAKGTFCGGAVEGAPEEECDVGTDDERAVVALEVKVIFPPRRSVLLETKAIPARRDRAGG